MIINLTQHNPTPEQEAAGVTLANDEVKALLTFTSDDRANDTVLERADRLAQIAEESGATSAMVGGMPRLMAPLEKALWARGVTPLYSFTERQSVDIPQPDGAVKKTQVFRHVGFDEAVR